MKPEGSLPCSQQLVIALVLIQMNPIHTLPSTSSTHLLQHRIRENAGATCI
jgi:hypothetical protein